MRNIRKSINENLEIGDIYKSNSYGDFKIVELDHIDKHHEKWYLIEFIETGFPYVTKAQSIKNGSVKDYMLPTVYGVGYLGERNLINNKHKKFIGLWRGMLGRCYSESNASYEQYGGIGVTVDERWHNYKKFAEDIPNLEGYDEDLYERGLLELDKDIKQVGINNKVYSKDTCIFITPSENVSFGNDRMRRDVLGYNPKDGLVEVYNCNQFAKDNNIAIGSIYRSIDGESLGACGWVFINKNEFEGEDNLHKRWKKHFKKSRKKISIDGITYKSISEASRALKRGRQTIRKMVEDGSAYYIYD